MAVATAADDRTVVRSRWWRPRVPATVGYLTALVVVTSIFSVLSDSAQTKVVLHASTNLQNLLNGRVVTLLSSALVIGDVGVAWLIMPLLASLLALAELRFGALRMVRVFLAGHVGATLLVAAGLWVSIEFDWMPASVRWSEDVGISYGAMALIGALVFVVPRRMRIGWAAVWFVGAIGGVLIGQTFTNVGHLLAFGIGSGVGYAMIRTKKPVTRQFTKVEWALLGISSVLAGAVLFG
ncbi:rhomboid-like protein [Nocardia altamirensis]|uniref:rhomboid-like protein n=1 Tax=Nocardia altamirensis TaxID=472158 RepID=UPI00083FE3C6|nr:rhomboid-like protein [Nocardia altamirensis]